MYRIAELADAWAHVAVLSCLHTMDLNKTLVYIRHVWYYMYRIAFFLGLILNIDDQRSIYFVFIQIYLN